MNPLDEALNDPTGEDVRGRGVAGGKEEGRKEVESRFRMGGDGVVVMVVEEWSDDVPGLRKERRGGGGGAGRRM